MSTLAGDDTLVNPWDAFPVPGTGGNGTNAAGINANVNKNTLAWQIWKDKEDRRLAAEALARTTAQDDEDRRIAAEDRTRTLTDAANLRTNTQDYYTGGTWKNSFGGLRDAANTAASTATGSIDTNLAGQLGDIAGAYGDATGTTTNAYNDLINYLTSNPNNPYAGQSVSAGQVGNDMSQLMQAYGLDTGPTQQYVGATNAANNSTAQQFNNLLKVLSRMSASSDASRMTEARSGSTNALSNLAGMNASNVSSANSAATAARNKIAQDLLARQAGIDSDQAAEDERLRQLLITLGVNPNGNPKVVVPTTIVPKVPGDDKTVDETVDEISEIDPVLLAELRASLAGIGAGFGQGFLTR